AVGIRRLQADKTIRTAMVVDTDVHQGNGTATIFAGDPAVFTLSIHQENNYPFAKPLSSMDINLQDGTGDEDYLPILEKKLFDALEEFHPDVIFYLAGADPYREDQLGGLALSIDGQRQPAELIFAIGIGAGKIKNHIGMKFLERVEQFFLEDGKIVFVARAVLQVDVHAGEGFGEGIIVLLVDGEGEDGGIAGKNGSGSIALMHVGIDDHGGANCFVRLEPADAHR